MAVKYVSVLTLAVKNVSVLATASYLRVPGTQLLSTHVLKSMYPKATRTVLQIPAPAEGGSQCSKGTRGACTSHSPFTQYKLWLYLILHHLMESQLQRLVKGNPAKMYLLICMQEIPTVYHTPIPTNAVQGSNLLPPFNVSLQIYLWFYPTSRHNKSFTVKSNLFSSSFVKSYLRFSPVFGLTWQEITITQCK